MSHDYITLSLRSEWLRNMNSGFVSGQTTSRFIDTASLKVTWQEVIEISVILLIFVSTTDKVKRLMSIQLITEMLLKS